MNFLDSYFNRFQSKHQKFKKNMKFLSEIIRLEKFHTEMQWQKLKNMWKWDGPMLIPCPSLMLYILLLIQKIRKSKQGSTDQNRKNLRNLGQARARTEKIWEIQDQTKCQNLGPDWTRTNKILKISDRFGYHPTGRSPDLAAHGSLSLRTDRRCCK